MKKHDNPKTFTQHLSNKMVDKYLEEKREQPNSLSASPAVEDLRTKGKWQLSKSREVIFCGAISVANTHGHSNSIANAAYIVNAVNNFENLKAENTKLAADNERLLNDVHVLSEDHKKKTERITKLAASNLELREALEFILSTSGVRKFFSPQALMEWNTAINNSKGAE